MQIQVTEYLKQTPIIYRQQTPGSLAMQEAFSYLISGNHCVWYNDAPLKIYAWEKFIGDLSSKILCAQGCISV